MKEKFNEFILPILLFIVLSSATLFFFIGSIHFIDVINESKIDEKAFCPSCRFRFKKIKGVNMGKKVFYIVLVIICCFLPYKLSHITKYIYRLYRRVIWLFKRK
ncbi:MAG: hypothetical protein J6M60_03545 [Clostridia bacterium]|nr:hypothetical protein [Clostridia bacterium]